MDRLRILQFEAEYNESLADYTAYIKAGVPPQHPLVLAAQTALKAFDRALREAKANPAMPEQPVEAARRQAALALLRVAEQFQLP